MRLATFLTSILILAGQAIGAPEANPVIYAPAIGPIALDGDFSDWSSTSAWADFGEWFGGGLASTSRARYAWNDTQDLLYVGVESTEGETMGLELGGLMGRASATAMPFQGTVATQLTFTGWNSGTANITNNGGGIITDVVVGYTFSGTTMTIEVALPIYGDWMDGGSKLGLSNGMNIYEYANVQDQFFTMGDSQVVTSGSLVQLFSLSPVDTSSIVRLVDTLPAQCDDLPDAFRNAADMNDDCIIDLGDFSAFAMFWMQCTDPENATCDQFWIN